MTPRTFAEAVDMVAHSSVTEQGRRMTVEDIATRIAKPVNYLRKAVSQYDDAHPFRGDLIVPMTMATRNFAIVEHIAAQCGGVFFQLPAVHASNVDVIEQTARTVREFGDVLTASAQALADNRVTHDEARTVCVQIDEAIAALAQFKQLMVAKAEPSPMRMVKGA